MSVLLRETVRNQLIYSIQNCYLFTILMYK